jgi:hypothetical protein
MKVSFESIEEIKALKACWLKNKEELARSSLGLLKQKEDWVFSLNIGNVM